MIVHRFPGFRFMDLSNLVNDSEQVVAQLLLRAKALGLNRNDFEIALTVKNELGDKIEFEGKLRINIDCMPCSPKSKFDVNAEPSCTSELLPIWNGSELWFKDLAIKRFRRPARNQQKVLAVFQEEGWPKRIDNPIPANERCDAQSRLHDTIKSLNRNHIPDPSPIKFRGDGTGSGVIWEEATW